jgi:hypothetical protein
MWCAAETITDFMLVFLHGLLKNQCRLFKLAAVRLAKTGLLDLDTVLECVGFSERTFYQILKLWRETRSVVPLATLKTSFQMKLTTSFGSCEKILTPFWTFSEWAASFPCSTPLSFRSWAGTSWDESKNPKPPLSESGLLLRDLYSLESPHLSQIQARDANGESWGLRAQLVLSCVSINVFLWWWSSKFCTRLLAQFATKTS